MQLPFSIEQFYNVFRAYKTSIWPALVLLFAGLAVVVFALAVYPAWSVDAGHGYPALPTFGAPCPTTIFTLGLMAFVVAPYPRSPLVVPVIWCFVGGQAVLLLGVPPDSGLIASRVDGHLPVVALPGG